MECSILIQFHRGVMQKSTRHIRDVSPEQRGFVYQWLSHNTSLLLKVILSWNVLRDPIHCIIELFGSGPDLRASVLQDHTVFFQLCYTVIVQIDISAMPSADGGIRAFKLHNPLDHLPLLRLLQDLKPRGRFRSYPFPSEFNMELQYAALGHRQLYTTQRVTNHFSATPY